MSTEIFQVEETERKQIKSGKREGQYYLRVKPKGGRWSSVWGKDDANTILENSGASFKGEFKETDYGVDLTNVSVSTDESASNGGKPSTQTQTTEADWRAKERRERFSIAWAVVYKTERENQVTSDLAMEKALKYAGLVVSAAEGHAATYEAPFS